MMYNGQQYSWVQFKEYWKAKMPGGWLFDDTKNLIDANKRRFEDAWTVAGPVYCKNEGLFYVNYNQSK